MADPHNWNDMFRLVITQSDGKHLEYYAEGTDLLIGRTPLVNDICIDDPSISRQHVKLTRKKDHVWVQDLESQNGILVDGKRLAKGKISFGQSIQLGNVRVDVYIQDQAVKLERLPHESTQEGDLFLRPNRETAPSNHLGTDTLNEAHNLTAEKASKE